MSLDPSSPVSSSAPSPVSSASPTAPCVLVVDPVHPQLLRDMDERYEVRRRLGLDQEGLRGQLADADAIVLRSGVRLGAAEFDAAPRLRVVARAGVGVDNIDLDAARERGVRVFNVPDLSAVSVAEFTFALMLAAMRHVAFADRELRAGRWRKPDLVGTELAGKTLGIVGLGRIGTCVAAIAGGFGMRVVASVSAPTPERAAAAAAKSVTLMPTADLLETADVVCLHCPLVPATRRLIDAAALDRMKPTAFLINLARGGVVDEDALLDALEGGRIAGAACDVFAAEKRASPLFALERFVAAPHIGAMTDDAQRRIAQTLFDDLVRALSGEAIVNRVA